MSKIQAKEIVWEEVGFWSHGFVSGIGGIASLRGRSEHDATASLIDNWDFTASGGWNYNALFVGVSLKEAKQEVQKLLTEFINNIAEVVQ